MPIDDGQAIHYAAVERGTPVYSSDEVQIGTVHQIADNYREHIFDGVVVRMSSGEFRFADAPEVARTAERGLTLTITADEAQELPAPDKGVGSFRPNLAKGRVSKLFGRGWKRG